MNIDSMPTVSWDRIAETTACLTTLFAIAQVRGLTVGAPTRQNEGHVATRFGDYLRDRTPIRVFLDGEEVVFCVEAQASLPDSGVPGTVILLEGITEAHFKPRYCTCCGGPFYSMRHGDVRIERELPPMQQR